MKGHRFYAAFYDFGARFEETRMAPLREEVAGQAEGRVLEIGCGTGFNLPYYRWAMLEAVEATDPDRFMLAKAVSKAEKMAPYVREKLSLSQAPAEELPFEDAGFDTVVATLVLCTVDDLDRTLAEVRRVLKPGGVFRMAEHVRGEGRTAKVQDFVQPVYGWMSAGCHLGRRTEAAIEAAGFRLEVTRRLQLGPMFPAFTGKAYR